MTDVFLSYKREDRDYARAIAEYLIEDGYEVWWDINLLPGDRFADEINEILNIAKAIVVLWTPEATNSYWVKSEATVGLSRNNLIPVRLRDVNIPVPFNTLHALDLSTWHGDPSASELRLLREAISQKVVGVASETAKRSPEEVSRILAKPEHEVEFWTSITTADEQTIEEYELYLKRYGENGSFAKLAHRRIRQLREPRRTSISAKEAIALLGVLMGIAVGGFTIADHFGVFNRNGDILEDPDDEVETSKVTLGNSAPEPKYACEYIHIKNLGWSSGHKTNFCKANGYEQGNFNQGDYKNGGICLKGPNPQICKAAFTGRLGNEGTCEPQGALTSCYTY